MIHATEIGTPRPRVCAVVVVSMALFLAACGNPRRGAPLAPSNNQPGPVPTPSTAVLATRYSVGQRFRTTRTLAVREQTDSGFIVTQAEEVALTEVKLVDAQGRLLAIIRNGERSRTSHGPEGAAQEATGALEGSVLELRRADAVSPVSVSVHKGEASLANGKFLLDGFDTALLPAGAVAEGEVWNLEGLELAGLNAIIEALGLKIENNRLSCRVTALGDATAAVSLYWRLSGMLRQQPTVMEFSGALELDRRSGLIRRFNLTGGRQGGGKSVEITVTRAPVG